MMVVIYFPGFYCKIENSDLSENFSLGGEMVAITTENKCSTKDSEICT